MATLSRRWSLNTANYSITPFLYQTCTLTKPLQPTTKPYSTTTEDPNEQDQGSAPSQPPKNERKARPSYLQRHAARRLTPRLARQLPQQEQEQQQRQSSRRPRMSMTRSEKKVFGELLDQLEKTETTRKEGEGVEGEEGEGAGGNVATGQMPTILDSVLADIQGKRKRRQNRHLWAGQLDEGEFEGVDEEGVGGPRVDISELMGKERKNVPMERAIGIVVRRESEKIEEALNAAIREDKGDVGVWDVCERRIFSLLGHISQDVEAGAGQRQQQQEEGEGEETGQATLEIPSAVPKEPVFTSLYPKVLLVAFRLLNLHFPNSPLIGQFRSTISSHGAASTVLGTSTGLYNELIFFYWRGCSDIAGVVSLLREMEVTGVEPNRRTCKILRAIMKQRESDLKGDWLRRRMRQQQGLDRGQVDRELWWDMAPNRRAVRELVGPEGWMKRLEQRMEKLNKDRRRRYY